MNKEHMPNELNSHHSAVELIFSQRAFLMGASMLALMLLHQTFLPEQFLLPFSLFGQYGADVFLFVSGMGISSSLKRNNLHTFYVNRFIRLLPAWLFIGLLSGIVGIIFFEGSWKGIVLWLSQRWFLNALVCFYLLSPIIKRFIERYDLRGMLLSVVFCELLLVYYCTPGSLLKSWPYLDSYLLYCTLRRIPAFLLGMYMVLGNATIVERWSRSTALSVAALLIACGARMLQVGYISLDIFPMPQYSSYAAQLPYPILALALPWGCRIVSQWSSRISSLCIWRFMSGFMGALSLELYLWHVWIYPQLGERLEASHLNGWLCLIIAMLLSGIFAWGTQKLCATITAPVKKLLLALKR